MQQQRHDAQHPSSRAVTNARTRMHACSVCAHAHTVSSNSPSLCSPPKNKHTHEPTSAALLPCLLYPHSVGSCVHTNPHLHDSISSSSPECPLHHTCKHGRTVSSSSPSLSPYWTDTMVANVSDWLSILTTGVGCLTSTEEAWTLQRQSRPRATHSADN